MSGGHTWDNPSRPVRVPENEEARLALAKDLSRTHAEERGFDFDKVMHMQRLPLFEVAIEGFLGVRLAERFDQSRQRKAA